MTERPALTVTLTRYAEADDLVWETLESLSRQVGVDAEILFYDQDWREDFAARVEALSSAQLRFSCRPCPKAGLSHARNLAIAEARHDRIAYIDPDAIAAPDWALHLASAMQATGAAIAGARILPKWRGREPLISRARVVRDQYSLLDWGSETRPAPRVVGAAFALNRSIAREEMVFDTGLGRRDGKLYSGEESDLSARVSAAGGMIIYVGGALVHHQILPERQRLFWVQRRLYFAGLSRGTQKGAPAPSQRPGLWDWIFLPLILPPYALGWLKARRVGARA